MSEPNAGGAIDMAGAENLSTEESPTLESNPGADNAADSVKDRAEGVDPDADNPDKDEPLHKNPRFKEVIRQNREMRKKLADLEKGKEQTREPEKSEPSKQTKSDFYDRMFEGSPDPEFRPAKEYKDIGDLYRDIRRQFLADMDFVRQSDESARSKATAEFESQLGSIKEDLGDDAAFDSFASFLEQVIQKHPTADVDMVFDLWLERYEGGEGKPEDDKSKDQQRKPSKVNKSNKPPVAKGKKPSYEYIRSRSMDDIIADLT